MNTAAKTHPVYRFGAFEANPNTGELLRKGVRVRLQEQPFQMLVVLLENAGDLVNRDFVRQRLWSENTFVDFDASLSVAIGKLREALGDSAENPKFIETVPRRGYRFIAPVKAETSGGPSRITLGQSPPAGALSNLSVGKYSWIIAGLLVLLVGTAVYVLRPKMRSARPPAPAGMSIERVHLRRAVAVLGFRNLPGRPEDNWLSSAFCEMLNTELAAGGELRMVPGEDVARAKRELPLTDEDSLGKSTLQRLRTNPGADVIVVGSYTIVPSDPKHRIRLDVRLQDTASGDIIGEEAVSGDENDLFNLVGDLGDKLRQQLGAAPISEEGTVATRAALPSNETAARLYAEGRASLWAFDFASARDLLNKAIAADPDFPLSHAALSDVWWHTGYDAKAGMEARRALELSNHLSQEQRLLVEGQYQRTIQEWPKAVETYRSLFGLFPDNLAYGLLLASAQMHLSPSDSLRTLAALRHLPLPLGDDARIDVTEASAWINRDFAKARAAAKLAIEKATAQGSPVIVSRAYAILCQQEPSIEASAEAISICKSAVEASVAAKDLNGEAMMSTDLAALYYLRGDLAGSAQVLQQAVKKFRQVGNRDGVATALSNFADTRLSRGDLMEAKKLLEKSIPEYQAVDDKEGVVLNLDSLGDIWRQNGKLDRAETTYQKAEGIGRKTEDKNATAYVLTGMGDVALDRGDLPLARKRYEEALALRTQAGEKQSAAESRVSLAKLAIEEGHPPEAEAAVRQCLEQFQKERQADDELTAHIVLIDALLAQAKQSDAQKEMEAARRLGNESQNPFFRLQFQLASGRVLLASDHPEASSALFQQVARDAHHYKFVGLAFADELAVAELANKTNHRADAQTELHALQKSAASKGFGLIARKASQESSVLRTPIGAT